MTSYSGAMVMLLPHSLSVLVLVWCFLHWFVQVLLLLLLLSVLLVVMPQLSVGRCLGSLGVYVGRRHGYSD